MPNVPEGAALPAPKKLTMRPTAKGALGIGTIESIHLRDDDEKANITIRHGSKPKKDKHGMTVGPYPETNSVSIPFSVGKKLRVGQRVRLIVEPLD